MPASDTAASESSSWRSRSSGPNNLKIKMLTLTGMLLMVVYAMHEAGKPENWAWMNFPQPPTRAIDPGRPTAQPATVDPGLAAKTKADQPSAAGEPVAQSHAAAIRLADLSPRQVTPSPASNLPADSQRFWQTFFRDLELPQQLDLLAMCDQLLAPNRLDEPSKLTAAQQLLLNTLIEKREAFDDRLLDQMTSLPESSGEKSNAAKSYFDADKFWTQNIAVVMNALKDHRDITLSQHRELTRLMEFLESTALKMVEDDTAIGWTGDTLAWRRCWKYVHAKAVKPPQAVTRIQLMAQPDEYRGRSVSVAGDVRSIQFRTAPVGSSVVPPSGQRDYYIAWVEPVESQVGPYCIYCNQLPEELPRNNEKLPRHNTAVKIEGLFFKNRRYPAASGEVLSCPLILVTNIQLQASQSPVAATVSWQPSLRTGLALALGIPLIAIGGSYLLFRAARTRKRLPSEPAQQAIGDFLDDLKDDPNVQTDLEKVQAIGKRDNDGPE